MDRFEQRLKERRETKKLKKFSKWDWCFLVLITILYACVAFYRLGDLRIPSTQYTKQNVEDNIVLDFGKTHNEITQVCYYMGEKDNFTCYLEESNDGIVWKRVPITTNEGTFAESEVEKFKMEQVFSWQMIKCHIKAPFVRLVCKDKNFLLREFVFRDKDGKIVLPQNASQYNALFDEQRLCPKVATYMNSTIFDEVYYARTAYEYLHGQKWFECTHPPFGKIIVAVGIKIFGMCPFGWRSMGTLFGVLMLPVFYLFLRRLCDTTWISALGTALFAADFMHFTQTRLNTIDVYVTFFIILMYYFALCYVQTSFYDTSFKKGALYLLGTGVFTGFACATKWTGVYATAGVFVLVFLVIVKRFLEYDMVCKGESTENEQMQNRIKYSFRENIRKTGICFFICLLVLPCFIYAISYLPFSDGTEHGWIRKLLDNQAFMYHFHANNESSHAFSSWNFEWPIMEKPIWYVSSKISDTVQSNISAFGNPLVWWVGIPVFLYMIYRVIRKQDTVAIFLSLAYLSQFLPWGYVMRITFIYHYFPCVPFVVAMIAYTIFCLWKSKGGRFQKQVKLGAVVYLGCTIFLFGMFYPVISGYPVSTSYVKKYLQWNKSWVLYQEKVKHINHYEKK